MPGAGELTGMTGIDDPYEPPLDPEVHLEPGDLAIQTSVVLASLPVA